MSLTPSPFVGRRSDRAFCRIALLAVLGLCLSLDTLGAEAARPADARQGRPNILLLLADNWAAPHSSFAGDRTVRTPNFDRLAREGMYFDNAFCPVPSCSPTRASMLAGRYAHQLGEAVNLWSSFPPEHPLLTDLLRRAGYLTAYSGKGWAPGNYVVGGWAENPVGHRYADFASFLERTSREQPFFFWVGNLDTAIGQWDYRPEAAEGLAVATVHVPAHLPDTPEVRAALLAYYNGVRRFDRAVGEAMAALERHGLADNTIVVCCGDNGWQIPRGLANCYDDGLKVPMVVWGKAANAINGKRRESAFVSLGEFAPTVLELAGLPVPVSMTCNSFAGLIRGTHDSAVRDAVFVERERHANVRAGDLGYPIRGIRTRDHLLLLNLRPDRWPAGDPVKHQSVGPYGDIDNGPIKTLLMQRQNEPGMRRFFELSFAHRPAVELYDLHKDPEQLVNVAGRPEYAAVLASLRQRVVDWMRATQDPRMDPADNSIDGFRYYGDVNTWDKDNFDGAHLFTH